MYALLGLGGQEAAFLFLLFIGGLFLLLPILALIDIVRNDFRGQNDKLIWVIVVIFMPFIGSLLYYFIGRNQQIA